jgi:RNA-directed DNA polymerase
MLKRKIVRLKGKELRELNEAVYERDQHCCVNCTRWVEEGNKFHHVVFKSQGGGDTLDNAVLLCYDCHQKVHSAGGYEITEKLKRYLEWMQDEFCDIKNK